MNLKLEDEIIKPASAASSPLLERVQFRENETENPKYCFITIVS
ncbi:MAG: hypothetical protein CM15mP23_07000 [Cryomorphaceae bacterium]|nr:MAG: hypothetical protein CM15mP23_07000 [Cryomorphaceae bacterium]